MKDIFEKLMNRLGYIKRPTSDNDYRLSLKWIDNKGHVIYRSAPKINFVEGDTLNIDILPKFTIESEGNMCPSGTTILQAEADRLRDSLKSIEITVKRT